MELNPHNDHSNPPHRYVKCYPNSRFLCTDIAEVEKAIDQVEEDELWENLGSNARIMDCFTTKDGTKYLLQACFRFI